MQVALDKSVCQMHKCKFKIKYGKWKLKHACMFQESSFHGSNTPFELLFNILDVLCVYAFTNLRCTFTKICEKQNNFW